MGGNLLFNKELLFSVMGVGGGAVFTIMCMRGQIVSGVLSFELINFEGDAFKLVPGLGDGTIHYIIICLTESLPIINSIQQIVYQVLTSSGGIRAGCLMKWCV